MIEIKLNNQIISVEEGKTILEVAKANGIEIPTLCHDKELNPYGSCWVCAVEVKGRRGFVTSCGTIVQDKMEIITNSEEVIKARQMALELLISDHYADCEAPCKVACPDHVDIQSYVAAIANGQYHEAVRIIKETLPMPLSIGRVCPAFCEKECRRTIVEEAVAIRQLKRHASDMDLLDVWQWVPEKAEKKDKKVAVIGAGPSGLTCGYYLSNSGYDVDVFESAPEAGGWLRYGIPEYRLPKEILDKEIELMCTNGMKIHTNKEVGSVLGLSQLSKEYDAVYMAIGAQKAVDMPVKGNTLKGCYLGVDYLKQVALGNPPELGKRVAVVGGGNTAIDCARTAKRFGADVTIIYRRTRQEMPAEPIEIDASHEEDINFYMLMNPVEYLGDGKLEKIVIEKMKLGTPDSSGRCRPEPTGEYITEPFDNVIAAISQIPEIQFLAKEENRIDGEIIPLSKWSTIIADENSMFTGLKNIFGGGDFRRGPATAIEAISDGRIAAEKITEFLEKGKISKTITLFDAKKEKKLKDINPKEFEQYEKIPRAIMKELTPQFRKDNFEEVETGFSQSEAIQEAKRCLECGCQVNETCLLREYSTEYRVNIDNFIGEKNRHPIDDSHPFIRRDANKCIKCGRCIRICTESQGAGVLGYIYRGFPTLVAPEFGESLTLTSCESCGKCIAVCPVGALTEKNSTYKLSPLTGTKIHQYCGNCGTGCKIKIDVNDQKVRLISHPDESEEDFNERNLCFNGRFGWQIYTNPDRPKSPMIREDEKWKEISYKELKIILHQKIHEFDSKHFFVSGDLSLEELLLVHTIAQNKVATVSKSVPDRFTDDLLYSSFRKVKLTDLVKSETIIIIGEISHTIRTLCRSAQKKGCKLILVNPKPSSFNHFADAIYDDIENLKTITDITSKTIFIYNRENTSEEIAYEIWNFANTTCDFCEGSGVLITSKWSNMNGLITCNFPYENIKEGLIFSYKEDFAKKNGNSYQVLIHNFIPEDSEADLFIPAPCYLEMEASVISDDGHIATYSNAVKSNLFYMILNIFYETGLISPALAEPSLWNNKVEEILEGMKENNHARESLNLFLNSVSLVNQPYLGKMTKEEEIQKLKALTKK